MLFPQCLAPFSQLGSMDGQWRCGCWQPCIRMFLQPTLSLQCVVCAMPSAIFPAGLDGRTMAVRLLAAFYNVLFPQCLAPFSQLGSMDGRWQCGCWQPCIRMFLQPTLSLQCVVSARPGTIFPAGLDAKHRIVMFLLPTLSRQFCCFRNAEHHFPSSMDGRWQRRKAGQEGQMIRQEQECWV